MNLLDTLKSKSESYTRGDISLETLRDWFAPYSIEPESEQDAEFTRIAYELIGDLSDLDDGFLTEEALKENLKSAFNSPSASSSLKIQLSFGLYSTSPARSASSTRREPVPA